MKHDVLKKDIDLMLHNSKNKIEQTFYEQITDIDEEWINRIASTVECIEKITKSHKSFIKETRELQNIERAKKVDAYSIRHLASHSQYIKNIDNSGFVTPSKILSRQLEQDNALYENLVVINLIDKIYHFIDKRLDKLINAEKTKNTYKLTFNSSFSYNSKRVKYNLGMDVIDLNESKSETENSQRVNKLKWVHDKLNELKGSSLYKELNGQKLIRSPLNRTNVFRSDVNYRSCYEMWSYIEHFEEVGYSISLLQTNLPMSQNRYDKIIDTISENIADIMESTDVKVRAYGLNPKSYPKKDFVVSLSNQFNPEKLDFFDKDEVNEYYYKKMTSLAYKFKLNNRSYDKELSALNGNFNVFYRRLNKINNLMYEEIFANEKKSIKEVRNSLKRKTRLMIYQNKCDDLNQELENLKILEKLKKNELASLTNKIEKQKEKIKNQNEFIATYVKNQEETIRLRKEREKAKRLEKKAIKDGKKA